MPARSSISIGSAASETNSIGRPVALPSISSSANLAGIAWLDGPANVDDLLIDRGKLQLGTGRG